MEYIETGYDPVKLYEFTNPFAENSACLLISNEFTTIYVDDVLI